MKITITEKQYKLLPDRLQKSFNKLPNPSSDEVVELFPGESHKSASRFFYCAKSSKSERNKGCEELEDKLGGSLEGGDDIRNGQPQLKMTKNNHPTVKPIALMEYLVKLVSREGALVLDPFAGSGSTLLACKNLNRGYVGIEMDEEYIKIINARLK